MPRPSNAPQPARLALVPAFLGAIIAMAGLALVGTGGYIWIDYGVAIFAAIVGWFAIQARQWWWVLAMLAIVVLWNPVLPLPFPDLAWSALTLPGAATFIAAGVLVKVTPRD